MYLGDSVEDLKLNIPGFFFQTRQTQINSSNQIHAYSYSHEQWQLHEHIQTEMVALVMWTTLSASSHCLALVQGTGRCWWLMLLCTSEHGKHTVEEKLQVLNSPSATPVTCTACTGFQIFCFNSCGSKMLLFPAELVLRSSPGSRCRSASWSWDMPEDDILSQWHHHPHVQERAGGQISYTSFIVERIGLGTHPMSACWLVSCCSFSSNVWMGFQHWHTKHSGETLTSALNRGDAAPDIIFSLDVPSIRSTHWQ